MILATDDPDVLAVMAAVAVAGPMASTQRLRRLSGLSAPQYRLAREWLRWSLSPTGSDDEEDEVLVGLNGRTPAELDEAEAMARRLRGEFRFIAGVGGFHGSIRRYGLLPVVSPRFSLDDLTPRAASAVIRATYRHVFRTLAPTETAP